MRTLLRSWVSGVLIISVAPACTCKAAEVDGVRLQWSSAGHSSKALILVHGWLCDESTWSSNVIALSRKYRVITLDLPGHGKSDSPRDGKYSMSLFARAVEAVRAEANANRIVLVGHSMGAQVVREYAHLYPKRVAGLVLVDGPLKASPPPPVSQLTGPNGLKVRESIIRGVFGASTSPEIQQHILRMMLAPPDETAVGATEASFDPAIWTEDAIELPVLGIYTENSRFEDVDYAKKIFPKFEHA